MEEKQKNIILGGGLTGLAAGYKARNSLIVEMSDTVGGLARTEKFDSFRFDLGGHRFLTKKKHIQDFVRGLLKDDLLEVKRVSKIFSHKKLLDYPPKPSLFLQVNPLELSFMLFSYLYRQVFPIRDVHSFRDRSINIFGDELYKYYFEKYTEKIWGMPCNKLSKDWVDARIPGISLKKVIKHLVVRPEGIKSFSDVFYYPQYGIGSLCDALADDLDINLSSKVTGLTHGNNKILSVITNEKTEVPCKKVVSTIPINELVRLLPAPPKVLDAASGLRYRNVICVFLAMDIENLTKAHWIYFPGTEVFGRLHEPKNWSFHMSPPDRTGICLEIFCADNDKAWKWNDLEIATSCVNDLKAFTKQKAIAHKVIRVENAYPVYDLEYKKNLDTVKAFLAKFENLRIAGRTGSFQYLNMDDCIEEGFKAAEFLGVS